MTSQDGNVKGDQILQNNVEGPVCSVRETVVETVCEVDCVDMDTQQKLFKVPPLKRKNDRPHYVKSSSMGSQFSEDQDIDSGSENSDSSLALSQRDFSTCSYDVDSCFLNQLKTRGVLKSKIIFPTLNSLLKKREV